MYRQRPGSEYKNRREKQLNEKTYFFSLDSIVCIKRMRPPFCDPCGRKHGSTTSTYSGSMQAAGHPLTSTEIQGNVVYVSAGTAQHRKTVHYSRRCHCGLRIEQYTKPDIYEAHTIRESVSGHNNGKHTVTRYCPLCAYSTSYTYDCPGGKNCISPTSIHEPY